jgi:hypothetical protein
MGRFGRTESRFRSKSRRSGKSDGWVNAIKKASMPTFVGISDLPITGIPNTRFPD